MFLRCLCSSELASKLVGPGSLGGKTLENGTDVRGFGIHSGTPSPDLYLHTYQCSSQADKIGGKRRKGDVGRNCITSLVRQDILWNRLSDLTAAHLPPKVSVRAHYCLSTSLHFK